MTTLQFKYNDGGRSNYFKADDVRDCVTRAIAIATGKDYKEVYDKVAELSGKTPRNGVRKSKVKEIVKYFGGEWHALSGIGVGCKAHLASNEIPMKGSIICQVSKHLTVVIDGVINDTFDPSRAGTRCVYGYYTFK